MAKAVADINGFIEIRDNKLSRPGVFEYLGSEIGAPEPNRIYYVLRPEEELKDPDCLDSFKLQPWIIQHKMLGKAFDAPPEAKGVHGVIGQDVYFDDDDKTLKGNIKIFSDSLEQEIDGGTDELSLGYRCVYEFGKTGTYNGERYNVIQTKIRGNHLALVDDSRSNVAVMDCAMDSNLMVTMDIDRAKTMGKKKAAKAKAPKVGDKKASTAQDAGMTIDEVIKALGDIMPQIEAMKEAIAMLGGGGEPEGEAEAEGEMSYDQDPEAEEEAEGEMSYDQDPEAGEEVSDMEETEDEEADKDDKDDKGTAMDQKTEIKNAVEAALKPFLSELNVVKEAQGNALDHKGVLSQINDRNALATDLSWHVGTFDHAAMTLDEVAKYGVDKLSIPVDEGHELGALRAYLHGREIPRRALYSVGSGEDSAVVTAEAAIDEVLKGGA